MLGPIWGRVAAREATLVYFMPMPGHSCNRKVGPGIAQTFRHEYYTSQSDWVGPKVWGEKQPPFLLQQVTVGLADRNDPCCPEFR
jgi:hypothetical protein